MKHSYCLSNKSEVYGDNAESVIDDCIDRGLFAGDFWANWCDMVSLGCIRVHLRAISLRIIIDECPRDEFMQFVELLTKDIPDKNTADVNEFYQMLLRAEIEHESNEVQNDLFDS